MAKKKGPAPAISKESTKAAKKAKAVVKTERKEKKRTASKYKAQDDENEDLESILEKMRQDWEDAHQVTEELAETPSRRVNATLTACPNGNHLWCIGGEFFSDDGKAYFYNDTFRYNPEKNEWRKLVSKVCPGPRSAHAVAPSPAGGGKLFIFGGEFSSLYQNSFHHYRDFWVFDITTHSWDRIETKERPSARSGHRMALWKHFIVLFGGFYDPGITTRYLNDLWMFDTQEHKWREVKFGPTELRPSPRSGFSFLPSTDGIILHGGYCKEYAKGKRPVGVMLEDTWFLNLTLPVVGEKLETKSTSKISLKSDPVKAKWERRKRSSTTYAPSLRSGCTMTLWNNKAMGVSFGGVTDDDPDEESLKSVFWNDLNGYIIANKGQWVCLMLRKPKTKGKAGKKFSKSHARDESDDDVEEKNTHQLTQSNRSSENNMVPEDPILTTPTPRYNAMLAVLRNTLYLYGGIFERGSKEYTLDDFYKIDLDKLDRFVCLKESGIVIDETEESSDDDDEDGDDDDDDDDEPRHEKPQDAEPENEPIDITPKDAVVDETKPEEAVPPVDAALREQATLFMGVAQDTTRSAEDVNSTPLPGETLAMFYARARQHWVQVAHSKSSDSHRNEKQLRRDAFSLAQARYNEYRPILKEVEKILAEAGLDEEEMRQGAAAGPQTQNRNRR